MTNTEKMNQLKDMLDYHKTAKERYADDEAFDNETNDKDIEALETAVKMFEVALGIADVVEDSIAV